MITVIWRSQTSPYTHTPHCSHYLDGTWDAPVLSVGNFSHGAPLWTAPVVLVPGPPVRHWQWHCDCRGHDSQILGQTNPVFPWWLRWEKKKKNLPAMQESWVQSLGLKDPREKGMATFSSILAWKIPRTEEPGSPWGCKRVWHDLAADTNNPMLLLRVDFGHLSSSIRGKKNPSLTSSQGARNSLLTLKQKMWRNMCQAPGALWISNWSFMVLEKLPNQDTHHRQAHIKEASVCICIPDTHKHLEGRDWIIHLWHLHRRAEQSPALDCRGWS